MYGLYIHIPFCRRKCHYCDFVSVADAQPELRDAYISALAREMAQYRDVPLRTIYMGGGTPSVLDTAQIAGIFSSIKQTFDCTHLSEVTFEANPESLEEQRLRACLLAGVNRISFGAQAFDDGTLVALGRVHTVRDFENAFHAARRFHFKNINCDLIYGLPGQCLEDWQRTLRHAVDCHPEHLSLYPLTIEPGTEYSRRGVTISEDVQARIYEWSMAFLDGEGYGQYEISNWALPGYESQHNLLYWHNREYIGLGAAAASHLQGRRWKNTGDLALYVRAADNAHEIVAEQEVLDDATRLAEDMILRLRTSAGIRITPDIHGRYQDVIERHLAAQLLERNGDMLRLTRRGRLLANQVFRDFV